MKNRCLVVGCNGKFGAIFAEKLGGEGLDVDGMDLAPAPARPGLFKHYLSANSSRPDQAALDLLAAADCVLLCVPESAVVDSIPILRDSVKSDAVIVDIASIKTRIEQAVRRAAPRSGYLSIHPMFGPLRSFESGNICVVPFSENEQSAWFIGLLEKWNAKLTTLSAGEHDRNAAYIQSMTHAALLQIAGALGRAGLPLETIEALSTPVQRAVLALCARIVSADPALYWEIQSVNPFASQARADYGKAWDALSDAVDGSDYEAFKRQFEEIAEYLGPALPSLADLSDAIVEIARDER